MILSIDFGTSSAKVLAVDKETKEFSLTEIPLGFRISSAWTVPEALDFIIREVSGGKKPDAVYASGDIASVKLGEVLSAAPLDPATVYQNFDLPVLDVGHSLTNVAGKFFRGEVAPRDIIPFLPFDSPPSELFNYLGNRDLYSQTVPSGERERQIELALARIRLRCAWGEEGGLFPKTEVVLTGAVFAKAADPALSLLAFADAFSLPPVCRVLLDKQFLLSTLGTLSFFESALAGEILEKNPLTPLGTIFSSGEGVLAVLDFGLPEKQELRLDEGNLCRVPLEKGKLLKVSFEGRNQKGEFTAEGGEVGLVFDARPKPLDLSSPDSLSRQKALLYWQEAICGRPLLEE